MSLTTVTLRQSSSGYKRALGPRLAIPFIFLPWKQRNSATSATTSTRQSAGCGIAVRENKKERASEMLLTVPLRIICFVSDATTAVSCKPNVLVQNTNPTNRFFVFWTKRTAVGETRAVGRLRRFRAMICFHVQQYSVYMICIYI